MDDTTLREALRPLARAILPDDEQRKQASVHAAFDAAGGVKPDAIRRSLPPMMIVWYLPGTVATGINVASEIELAGNLRLTQLGMRAKTPPSTTCKARITASGVIVADVTLAPGQSSGRTVIQRDDGTRSAGEVLRVDVTSDGGAKDVTITATYTVAG